MRGLVPTIGGENCGKELRVTITFEGKLKEEKANLEKRLADVNAEVLEALNKLGY